jgi:hypothetical protein
MGPKGGATAPPTGAADPWSAVSAAPGPTAMPDAGWKHHAFPGKTPTQFTYARHEGRDAMAAVSVSSASMLRRDLRIEPADLPLLKFSWFVPELIDGADLSQRDKDDSPARLVMAFEGDRSSFSPRNAMLSELARALTGEEMPYATLMYVWSATAPVGTVIVNPRTDRIRKIVVDSGPAQLGTWRDHTRDVRADFERAFGEPPGALLGIGLMTDSDNTASRARAWYGPIQLQSLTRR